MPNGKSNYFHIADLLQNTVVVSVAEQLSQRTCLPNVKSKYFNKAELLHNALVVRVAELL